MLEFTSEGRRYELPVSWLRENCRCDQCFYHDGFQRLLDPEDELIDRAKIATWQTNDDRLEITWNDHHQSKYDLSWLSQYAALDLVHSAADDFHYRVPWTTRELSQLPVTDYAAVMDGAVAYAEAVAKYGLVIIRDCPTAEGSVLSVARKISASGVRATNFGEMFDLRIHRHKNMKLAFTNRRISLHNDLVIRRQPPTVTLLHCLAASCGGGESTIADGLAIAETLRREFPAEYDCLRNTLVEIEDINADWHYCSRKCVIEEKNGCVRSINFNNWERSPRLLVHPSRYDDFRRAYQLFSKLAHSDEHCHRLPLRPGELLIIDNKRVLHGREAFDDDPERERHLQGCHTDIDDIVSTYRGTLRRMELTAGLYPQC